MSACESALCDVALRHLHALGIHPREVSVDALLLWMASLRSSRGAVFKGTENETWATT